MSTARRRVLLAGAVAVAMLAACSSEGEDQLRSRSGGEGAGAPSRTTAPADDAGTAPGTAPPAPTSSSPSTPDATAPAVDPAGAFVAVGYGARRVRSIDDGKTWVDDVAATAQGGDDDLLLRTVVYANGAFVGLGYRAVRSTDGKTWQPLSSPFRQWIGSATWEGARFVAVGGYGLRATSPDGTTWSDKAIDTVATHAHDALAFGGGRFAAANDEGKRSSSADGVTWTPSTGAESIATYALAHGNGVFVALGNTSTVCSVDGGRTFGGATTLGAPCRGLVFAQGHFTALANGHVFTSTDGTAWVDHVAASAHRGQIAYGHGTYVVLGEQGRQRSTDGLTWEAPVGDDGNKNPLEAITFGPL